MAPRDRTVSRRGMLAGLAGFIGAVCAVGTSAAWAQLNLNQARNQGLVGERLNGLLGVVQNSAGVSALVERVNAERLSQYREIAASTGAPLAAVQQQAGSRLIGRARSSGWYVESASGGWVR